MLVNMTRRIVISSTSNVTRFVVMVTLMRRFLNSFSVSFRDKCFRMSDRAVCAL
jgi:hypothetical protein